MIQSRSIDEDLALLEIEKSLFEKRKDLDALFGVALFFAVLLVAVPLIDESTGLFIIVSGAVGSRMLARRSMLLVSKEAARCREHIELATSVFLELVNVLMAGGAGVETSVRAAAEAGEGAGFTQLKIAVLRAHSSRTSYWESLAALGRETGVACLVEVAHTMQLAGESGARVRQSLVVKANALRKRNLARVEHAAEQRTEKIGLPLVVLFMGFLGLVGYPAFHQAMTSI